MPGKTSPLLRASLSQCRSTPPVRCAALRAAALAPGSLLRPSLRCYFRSLGQPPVRIGNSPPQHHHANVCRGLPLRSAVARAIGSRCGGASCAGCGAVEALSLLSTAAASAWRIGGNDVMPSGHRKPQSTASEATLSSDKLR
jgi:hypothetical protein